jgi:hypothetical protein
MEIIDNLEDGENGILNNTTEIVKIAILSFVAICMLGLLISFIISQYKILRTIEKVTLTASEIETKYATAIGYIQLDQFEMADVITKRSNKS